MRRMFVLLSFLLLATTLQAQQSPTERAAEADPKDEKGDFAKNCLFKHALGCAEVLFTGQPLHIALGSIAPQNGFGTGVALVDHKNTLNDWRISWNSDAVVSSSSAWRAGLYLTFVNAHEDQAKPQMGTQNASSSDTSNDGEKPVFNVYAQTISLNKLAMFGLGASTLESARSYYGMREIIVGGSVIQPINRPWHMTVYGEINGRSVSIRASPDQESPSIEQIYSPVSAPGLETQPYFVQLGAGLRIRPSVANQLLHLNYDVAYRPFLAASSSGFSFQRLTVDLDHEISLYRTTILRPRDTNGPDDCAINAQAVYPRCAPPSRMTSMEGTLGVRAFASLSMTAAGNMVPFYFQPTLGGADINGDTVLSSYQDYRFRASNLFLLREHFDHSFGKLPVGFALLADQATLATVRSDLGNQWLHSYAVGLTVRAGGFPVVYLLFAFGGNEGRHTLANMNTSLLGTAGRPSLF